MKNFSSRVSLTWPSIRVHLPEAKYSGYWNVNVPNFLAHWHPTPVLFPGESHGRRSLVGCSPWSSKESDTTERLPFHFSLSCIEEGNGNPLQRSCLENPRDGGAWWAAIYGVAQSRHNKRLSSSSSKFLIPPKLSVSYWDSQSQQKKVHIVPLYTTQREWLNWTSWGWYQAFWTTHVKLEMEQLHVDTATAGTHSPFSGISVDVSK